MVERKALGNVLSPEWVKREKETRDIKARIRIEDFEQRSREKIFYVEVVFDGSPAKEAGLSVGDVILADENPFLHLSGETMHLKVQRGRRVIEVELTPREHPVTKRMAVGSRVTEIERLEQTTEELENYIHRIPLEFQTASGEKIASGYYDLRLGQLKTLESLVLFAHEKDGEAELYDVVQRFNKDKAIIVYDPEIDADGHYLGNAGDPIVEIKDLKSPSATHTLLHELRHVEQEKDRAMADILPFYRSALEPGYNDDARYRPTNQNDVKNIYNILVAIMGQEAADAAASEWRKKYIDGHELPTEHTPVFGSVTVRDVLRLPTAIIERDAEYGALIGLRKIKQEAGIDFLRVEKRETEQLQSPLTVQKLTEAVDSLRGIDEYLNRIGLDVSCLRELSEAKKQALKKE